MQRGFGVTGASKNEIVVGGARRGGRVQIPYISFVNGW